MRTLFVRSTLPSKFCSTLLVLIALLFVAAAKAEEMTAEIEIETQARFVANADLNAATARVSQWSCLLDLSLPVAGSKFFGLGADIIAEKTEFCFHHFDTFIAGAAMPLSQASRVDLQPTLALTPNDRWMWVESVTAEYSGASGAKFNDGLLLSSSTAGVYRYDKNLRIGLGIQVSQRMPHSVRILPFPIIDWHVDHWSLTALDGETGRLSYAVTTKTSFYGQLEFRTRDIRLAQSRSLPSAILHYEAFPLFLGIQRKVNQTLTISLFVGSALRQQYRFEDRDGHMLHESFKRSPLSGGVDVDCTF